MLVFPYETRADRLKAFVRQAATLRLFTNDLIPTETTRTADLAEPVPADGYAPLTLAPTAWRLEQQGTSVLAVSGAAKWAFRRRGPTVYGHYAVDAQGKLLWAERLDDPFEVLRAGDELEIVVAIESKEALS